MKKIIVLALALMLTLLCVVSCSSGNEAAEQQGEKALKLGLGISTSVSASDATEDKDGQGQATFTAAAVLVDDEGKIVKAFIDVADNKVGYTFDGKAVSNDPFLTKYENGDAYNMVAYGGATLEWYEQADAFCKLIEGKTVAEVKALVAENAKGTEEVLTAGCTIYISDFVLAVEKAAANALPSAATKNSAVKLGISTSQTTADATEDKNGSNKVESTFFAAAVDADGKVVAASSDCIEVSFGFTMEGASTFDSAAEVLSKKEKGDSYNMKAYGGAKLEWYEQAAAFDATTLGKTASEIASGMGDELVAAGCTIYADGFVNAASKI